MRFLSFIRRYDNLIGLILIPILALTLRIYQYDIMPFPGETQDEYGFAWCGLTIINEPHIPTSWSWFKQDIGYTKFWNGFMYRIVSPWFNHPPLFGLVTGLSATLGGAKDLWEVDIKYIRIPSLIFALLTTILLYLLGVRLYGKHVAIISSLLYATIPIFVVGGRLAVTENMITPLLLLAILSTLKYFDTDRKLYRNLAGILGGLAGLCKVPGLFVVLVIALLLVQKKKFKDAAIASLLGILVFALYPLYGWYYDWNTFIKVIGTMGDRPAGMWIGLLSIFDIKIVAELFKSGWVLWGWLAVAYVCSRRDKVIPIVIVSYLFTLIAASDMGRFYGWHLLPFYPFLALAGGVFIRDLIVRPNLLSAGIFIAIAGLFCISWGLGTPWDPSHWFFRFLLVAMISPYIIHAIFNTNWSKLLGKVATYTLFCFFLINNCLIVYNFVKVYKLYGRIFNR